MNNGQAILSAVKEAVLSVAPNAEVILFGSRSRGDHSAESDWDFLILTEGDAGDREAKIRSRLYDIELATIQVISSIFHSKKEWEKFQVTPLYQSIEHEGKHV